MTDARASVAIYIRHGFRPIPLYGVNDDGCACGSPMCKERDFGKHEPPDTDGTWKDGATFPPSDFGASDNVALAMGPQTDGRWLVCLDGDGPFPFEDHLGPLPATMAAKSPRGEHRFFEVEPYCPLGNWVDCFRTRDTGAQLDLRYARGRIIVAPSRNAFGQYRWLDLRTPVMLPASALDAILDERRARGLTVMDRWERGSKSA